MGFTQDKQEEIRINLAQFDKERDDYVGSSWGDKKMKRVVKFLEKFFDLNHGSYTILDLGCGGMTLGGELDKIPSFDVVGIDLVARLLLELSKKRTPHIPLITGDAEIMPFKANVFDLIVHNQFIHHFFYRIPVLSEVKRVLKPGGLLVSIETNGWNPYVHYRHYSKRVKGQSFIGDNENPFSILRFTQELKAAGYDVIKSKMINFDFIEALSPFDEFFGKIPIFRTVFGGSMLVASRKPREKTVA